MKQRMDENESTRYQGHLHNLRWCHHTCSGNDLRLGQVDWGEGEVGGNELVVVAAAVLESAEGQLHVRTKHLIVANDIGPLHALLDLKFGLGVVGLGDFLRYDSLTTCLLEGKIASRTIDF